MRRARRLGAFAYPLWRHYLHDMGLVVLRRYGVQSEADAAAALLRASGFFPVMLDQVSMPPYSGTAALGGFRLAVPESEVEAAADTLRAALSHPHQADQAHEAYDDWWEDEADTHRPVMPRARRAGRAVLRFYVLIMMIMTAAGILGIRFLPH